ncbi:MAG: transglycosylase domain-containing protein [Acidimicrobiales bacterium]
MAKSKLGAPRSGRGGSAMARRVRRLFYYGLLVFIAAVAGFVHILGRIELPDASAVSDQTTIVVDRDGEEIARFHGEQNRVPLTIEEISPILVDAVISAEDRGFLDHPGVDPVAIARALWADIRSSGSLQGGSTITQQYVKNAFLSPERTLIRKLKEAALAIKLERETDKYEILEGYLNTIYFGRGAYGVGAAARVWFGVNASELNIAQASYLAGLIRGPEAADISRESQVDEAYRRRSTVLDAMLEEGYITAAERVQAEDTPIESYTLERRPNSSVELSPKADAAGAGYVVEMIRRELTDRHGSAALFQGGLRVTATIDLDLQAQAFEAATAVLDSADEPTAAVVVLDDTGAIRALVGGRDFETSQVNLALGVDGGGGGRQPGSSFKPIVLARALEAGISARSQFDSPSVLEFPGLDNGQPWVVHNYADASHGVIDLFRATAVSSNTAYAQLMLEVGPSPVAELAHQMGIQADLDPVHSLVLGTQEVSVLDMATAYSTFASRGERHDPEILLEVVDSEGVTISRFETTGHRVMSRQTADIVVEVLQGVVAAGTGARAQIEGVPTAGKTGTTQDYRDAWFVGFSPRFTTAVWVGFPDSNRSMTGVAGSDPITGGSWPAEIWRQVMVDAHRDVEPGSFVAPEGYPGEVISPSTTTTSTSTTVTSTTVATDVTSGTEQDPTTTVPDSTPVDVSTTVTTAQEQG